MTLIEVTVLLTVLGLVAGLMTGSVSDLLEQSRRLRTQEDVEHIGQAVVDFYADSGFFPRTGDTVDGRPGDDELGALISDAPMPETTTSSALWAQTRVDSMAAHLVRNGVQYAVRDAVTGMGWKGPYLSAAIQDDSWGHAYVVNVFWLDARDIVQDASGARLGAVWVLSAGPNGVIETPYYQPRDAAQLYGDDIGFRLQ
jgi:type II secretory pathway pseudopilin PulG